MSTATWIGNAETTAQIDTVTVGTYDATTTYKITVGDPTIGKFVSTLGTGGTATTTAAQLLTLIAAAGIPEFNELTWTQSGAVLTAKCNTPGMPVTISVSVSGGSGTISHSNVVANSGPNVLNLTDNWLGGTLPTTNYNIVIPPGSPDILWNLDQLKTVNIASVTSTGATKVGLLPYHGSGPNSYYEYRPRTLQFGQGVSPPAITLAIGSPTSTVPGTQRFYFDHGPANCTTTIYNSGVTEDGISKPIQLYGTGQVSGKAVATEVLRGGVDIEQTITSLSVGYITNPIGDADVFVGPNPNTGWTFSQQGGNVITSTGAPPNGGYNQINGTCTAYFTSNWTAGITLNGGTLNYNATGAGSGDITIGPTGKLNFSQDMTAKTLGSATASVSKGGSFTDPFGVASGYNVVPVGCTLEDITWITKAGGSFPCPS